MTLERDARQAVDMRDRADAIAIRLDRSSNQAALMHFQLDRLLLVIAGEIEKVVAANVVKHQRPADLERRAREPFSRLVRMRREVAAELLRFGPASKTDKIERSRLTIKKDAHHCAECAADALCRLVEIVKISLQNQWIERQIRERFGAPAPQRLPLSDQPLLGHIARENDRADDLIAGIANRRCFQVHNAIVIRARIANQKFGID